MHNIPSRPVDITFVGSLNPSMQKEIEWLTALGKALGDLTGAVQVSFIIEGMNSSELPLEISRYVQSALASFATHFEAARVVVLFDASSSDPALVKIASNAGAYLVIDQALAAKNRWLVPSTFAVANSSGLLLTAISDYFGSSIIDVFLSVALASREQTAASLTKYEEIKTLFPNVEGMQRFYLMQQERLKSRV